MATGYRKGVLGSDESGKIKGSKGPKKPSDVKLPNIKQAKGGNRPGEDGPYRPPDPKDVPGVPPGYPNIPKPKLARTRKTNSPNA